MMDSKPRLLVLNGTCLDVAQAHPEVLRSDEIDIVADASFRNLTSDRLDSALAGAHGLVLPASVTLSAQHMKSVKTLQVLSIAASGYEWLDISAATRCGIAVTNAPVQEGAEVVADLAFGLLLAVARQIPHHDHALKSGGNERGMGACVWGKTLGIVGLGNIGKAVARRARGFDMRVLAATPRPDTEFIRAYSIDPVLLEELLRQSDFVSLHARLNPQTRGMIGKRELGWMKPTAYLINTARQPLVDEEALTEAILSRRIAGAALDDPPQQKDSPLLKLPNFVCTPHLGNRALEGCLAVFQCALENARAVFQGKRPRHLLNPEVYEGPLRAPRPVPF